MGACDCRRKASFAWVQSWC
ncbi:Uricase [Zea mays]|uniref:Uricase n=1 Tax=Zea mays TaxID=4577 RepID=A0A1D6N6I2_MAIZE|nr:Uricase [Zea mays]